MKTARVNQKVAIKGEVNSYYNLVERMTSEIESFVSTNKRLNQSEIDKLVRQYVKGAK